MTAKTDVMPIVVAESSELEQVRRIALKESQLSVQIQAIKGKQGWRGESYHGLSIASLAAKLGYAELEQVANDGHAAMVQALEKITLPFDLNDDWRIVRRWGNICLDKNTVTEKGKPARKTHAFCGRIAEMAKPIIENIIVAPMTVDPDLAMDDQADVLRRDYQTRLNAVLALINKRRKI